jgi:hypothetical protein
MEPKELAHCIKGLSEAELAELADLLKGHSLLVKTDEGGVPTCPQGMIWNGSQCVVDPG